MKTLPKGRRKRKISKKGRKKGQRERKKGPGRKW